VVFNVLARFSIYLFVPKIFAISVEVVEKPNKCVKFLAPILGGMTPTFPRHVVSAIYFLTFGKVWLSSVC